MPGLSCKELWRGGYTGTRTGVGLGFGFLIVGCLLNLKIGAETGDGTERLLEDHRRVSCVA